MTWLRLGTTIIATLAATQADLACAESHTFRIRFGLEDVTPTEWNGSVSVEGGYVAGLRSWRPKEADRLSNDSWELATAFGIAFRYRNWEPEPLYPVLPHITYPGLYMTVEADADATVAVDTVNGNFSFRLNDLPVAQRFRYLDGAVEVERSTGYRSVSEPTYHNGFPDVAAGVNGSYWVTWIGYRDWANHVFARSIEGGELGPVHRVTTDNADAYYVRTIHDRDGGLLVVWADRKEGDFDLYARRYAAGSWSAVEQLTDEPGPDIHQRLVKDSAGTVWLAWQGFRNGSSDIFARAWDGETWTVAERVSGSSFDEWHPAVAADSKGALYVAWGSYENNDYDIWMRKRQDGRWSEIEAISDTLRYEAYPSLACDAEDRLWAAWNESGVQWGKDTGFLLNRPATQLYQGRWIAMAVRDGSGWQRLAERFEESLPADLQGFNDFPNLLTDGDGKIWALFRHRHLRQLEVPHTAAAHRGSWETYATAFDGSGWSVPVPLPATAGRSDAGHGFAASDDGSLYVAWATDNRSHDDYYYRSGEVFSTQLPGLTGPVKDAELRPLERDELRSFLKHPNERDDIARIRDYVIESEGRTYRIYRGDTHRHTEYSGDGYNDGAHNDTYRYAMNVADLDYLAISEHHGGGGPNIDYINWLLQQRVDVFHVPGRFVPLFGYERGQSYPNGHRNVVFAKRGNPIYPDQPGERETSSGAVGLFDYLRKYDGISIPHTSATNMGTDWRDDGGDVEPLVEIFQGDRVSAEYEGAPKAATEQDLTRQAGGFRPSGYVWNAWAKGYKLGVQASSDHLSTHISYSCTIAEEFTREGLLDGMRKRHNYAATDNIVLDYRMQAGGREYLQGDIVPGDPSDVELTVNIIGTGPISQVDVIRGQEFIYTLQRRPAETAFRYVDKNPSDGVRYYYVRVQQADGQMAWSSPIWVGQQ